MKSGFIDTHAHLTFPDYDKDREEVLRRAFDAGMEDLVVIGSGRGIEGNRDAILFAEAHEHVFAAVGIHPHDTAQVDIDHAVHEIKKLAESKKVVAIGEIGLDYFRNLSPADVQRLCLQRFLDLIGELKLPIIIHDRDAHKDIMYILRNRRKNLSGGIFHCFSGDADMAGEVVEMGFYIAVSGIITFKTADVLRDVVSKMPIERLVMETDCPYLAPEPRRGKRNEPAYMTYIASEIARIKGLSVEDVFRITTLNARRALQLPGLIPEGRIVYAIRKSLYLNITNHCTLACTFCPKRCDSFEVKGHNLKLSKEPDVEDVFRALGGAEGYDEVVFCGFGEPTLRLELMKEIARRLKKRGVKIRLDTDGLANLVHGRNILPELKGLIDSVSVSMNAPDPKLYVELCPSEYGEKAFFAMLSFLDEAKDFIPEVTATAVGLPVVNAEACEKLARRMGVGFRLRKYQEVG